MESKSIVDVVLMNSLLLSDTSSSLIICSLYMLWFSSFIPGLNYHALPYPETKENKIYTKDKIKLQHIYPLIWIIPLKDLN